MDSSLRAKRILESSISGKPSSTYILCVVLNPYHYTVCTGIKKYFRLCKRYVNPHFWSRKNREICGVSALRKGLSADSADWNCLRIRQTGDVFRFDRQKCLRIRQTGDVYGFGRLGLPTDLEAADYRSGSRCVHTARSRLLAQISSWAVIVTTL